MKLAMATRHKITHIIFDVDGLLLDTETIYTSVIGGLCKEYGKEYTWELKAQQMGRKEIQGANFLIDALNLPLTAEEYFKRTSPKYEEFLPNASLMPGAEKLVKHLHKHGVAMALASGSNTHKFELKIRNHQDLFKLFTHSVLSSSDPEVVHGKPAADCFLVCASRFVDPPKPENVLVFEDAPNGVEAGYAAGMPVVWVPDARADRSLLQDKACLILDSLEQFKPEDFGLPPYDS